MRPFLRQGAKAVGSEALTTGLNIITDMTRNTELNAKIRDIVRRNVTESAHRVINKLSGHGVANVRGRHPLREEEEK